MNASQSTAQHTSAEVTIEAPKDLPVIRMTRDFAATAEQLLRAHTDPDVFSQWVGPDGMDTEIVRWDASTGGHWQYVARRGDESYGFHGSFHDVLAGRIVQTFTFDEIPHEVALETLTFVDLGDGRSRLHAESVWGSFEARDGMISSGMEHGVVDGYRKLEALVAAGNV